MNLELPAQGWVPRSYQLPLLKYMMPERRGLRAVYAWPRRAGKDLTSINVFAMKSLQRKGLYVYIGPYQNQIRRILWNGRDGGGKRFIDYIPRELVERKLEQDMMLELKTGQTIQLMGADDPDRLVGINPVGVCFSEYSLCDPQAWRLIQPILVENGGWAMFNGTPRGKNHFYAKLREAERDPLHFSSHLTVKQTKHITPEELRAARNELNNEATFQSEYMCSFETPVEGSYYGDILTKLYDNGQILKQAAPEPQLPVHTAWDLGVDDCTSIWFFQTFRQEVRVLHYHEDSGEGLPHYASYVNKWLTQHGLTNGENYGPWDINVREWGTGVSRMETARSLGLDFKPVQKLSVMDGIEAVRNTLPKCWFNEAGCEMGIERLKGYHKEFDSAKGTFKKQPVHDLNSHGADSFRTLAVALKRASRASRSKFQASYESV